MFYFLTAPILVYKWILILAAIIPAIFLMIKVYRSDRLERESRVFLGRMVLSGVIATLPAMVAERIGGLLLNVFLSENSMLYQVLLYFVVVGFSEEGAKYFLLKKRSWSSREFNCQYDAVVYAVFVSLGFALWENISYVLHYGLSTAVVRAVTAIPGHTCFGAFMGIFYGLAKSFDFLGNKGKTKLYQKLAVLVPALIHGAYDYIASVETAHGEWNFIGFIGCLFVVSFMLVSRMSKNDRYFSFRQSYLRKS